MKFFVDNLYLIVLALVSGGLLLWPTLRRGGGAGAAVTPAQATALINASNAIVIDVRDEKAFATGSVTGARNLPAATLAEKLPELSRFKSRPVVVVCETGSSASRTLATFKAQGFEDAHPLAGGLAAWKKDGLPLIVAGPREANRPARDAAPKNRNKGQGARGGKRGDDARAPAAPKELAAPVVTEPVAEPARPADADTPPVAAATPDRVKEAS